MTEKTRIIKTLGEPGLLLPVLLNDGLAANDRAKYYFTLLQAAATHARDPQAQVSSLRRERLASGVDDETCDQVVAASTLAAPDRICIPGAGRRIAALLREVETMLVPISNGTKDEISGRLERLRAAVPAEAVDVLTDSDLATLTSGSRERGDSLHLVVMDAHRLLNALQSAIASESIDGASAYSLAPDDRPRVRAFMRGLRQTGPLKFDHPGLGTTATRSSGRLLIQNDIGTTDAHVLVIHVDQRMATLTYTDVHLQRLLFFQNLFQHWDVEWEDTRSRRDDAMEDGVYHLSVGAFTATDEAQLQEYLAFLGSRLVFLIDWNKARKRLRALLSKSEVIRLLTWAAEHDYGHMAFLKSGGEQLVYDALDFVVKGQARFGERLEDILGRKEAAEYMQFVLKVCADNLTRGEPESFAQDAVRAELFNYFRTGQQLVYDVAAEHAALVVEIASGIRDSLLLLRTADGAASFRSNARRAKEWERRADELVNRARTAAKHSGTSDEFRAIVEAADDIADELEEAAFRLTLIPAQMRHTPHGGLVALGELLVQSAQEYVKVIETARHVRRGGAREDMQDFLEATHRIMSLEQRTDEAQRGVEATLTAEATDFRVLHVLNETARNLEQAADALMHCSVRMRDHVLNQVVAA